MTTSTAAVTAVKSIRGRRTESLVLAVVDSDRFAIEVFPSGRHHGGKISKSGRSSR
jgi:hypothetical protein